MSRTPLREAFQRLAQTGLVEQIPRRGVFVRQPGAVELLEMFEVMAELEGMCGRLAARRITEQELSALREAHQRCEAAALAGDTDGIDGIEDIAGATIGPDTLTRMQGLGLDPRAQLDANNAHAVFEALGTQVITGPTLTNVNDLRAILIEA